VASWSFEKYIKILIQAFDQMDTMACIADLDGRIIFANRAALASVGTTLSEMKGRRLSDTPWRNYSENARKITDLMVIKAAEGETVRGEDFIRVPDGSLIPAIFSITPIIDHQEKVIGLVPQGNIIKELKEVQDRLESERWETREWLDCLSTCVAKCDLKGAVTSCNRAFVRALGISHEEIIGKTIYELPWLTYSEKERGRVQKAIETALGGDKVSIEVLFQTKKGEIAPFLVNMNFISDIEGRKAFLSVEAKDIAKQVELREEMFEREKQYSAKLKNEINQAIQALHETAKFNRNLIEFAPMGIIFLDADGKLIFANSGMKKKFEESGIAGNSVEGKKLSENYFSPVIESWDKVADLHEKGYEFKQGKLILNKNKKLIFEANTTNLRDIDGSLTGTIVVMNDITEKDNLENELFQARMQSEKLSSLGFLIAGLAHEINNPLTSIIGCAEYLAEDLKLKGKNGDALDVILKESRRTGQIVKNLLAFSRQSVHEKVTINMNDIITSVLDIRKYGLKDKLIKVELDLDKSLSYITGDIIQLQQVILNLINNAVDAISDFEMGGKITIRTFEKDGSVIVQVIDNGPGIPDDIYVKIFDPFFTTKKTGKGTGMGLSISYGIIKEHNGRIETDTEINKGTTFTIILPVKKTKKTKDIVYSEIWIPASVLVVDNEKHVCMCFSDYLPKLGCSVDVAYNTDEAIAKMLHNSYDLLFVDIGVPELNGMELYRRMLKDAPEYARRFVLMSGEHEPELQQFISKNDVILLLKPFERKDIKDIFCSFNRKIRGKFIDINIDTTANS